MMLIWIAIILLVTGSGKTAFLFLLDVLYCFLVLFCVSEILDIIYVDDLVSSVFLC